MLEVENGLNQQKEEFAMKMESLSQRREELARKESQLKESLMKFDKFLKENDAKRSRALKKVLEERRTKEQKESEITHLKDTQSWMHQKRDRGMKSVDINLSYQRYLEAVLETVEEFGEVKDIISRYDTLSATNAELIDRAREAQERTERDRLAFVTGTEEKNNVILNYNNQIAKLQTRLEETQLRSGRWQSEWDLTLKNATSKSLLIGQIKMATNNLFNLVKAHLNNRLPNASETLTQLDKIQQFIIDLNGITQDLTSSTPAIGSGPGSTGIGMGGAIGSGGVGGGGGIAGLGNLAMNSK
ncbi:Cilia- and flagella-associated protein 73 [Dinochytrium kinnereticum]|nr:Cilia- and flagella-associated protein 73 [Dinochytrium kinnereticum]